MVFMAHHIKPTSLEPHFPNVHELQNSLLVSHTLAGMKKLHGFTGTARKRALNEEDLIRILTSFSTESLDDLLFVTIIFTKFHTLLRLGEMMHSDTVLKRTSKKLSLRHTVIISTGSYSFVLPSHKSA